MICKDFVQRKFMFIQDDLAHLAEYTRYTLDDIAGDYAKQTTIERILEQIITRAINISASLPSMPRRALRRQRTTVRTFLLLSNLDVYPNEGVWKRNSNEGGKAECLGTRVRRD